MESLRFRRIARVPPRLPRHPSHKPDVNAVREQATDACDQPMPSANIVS
jgi:hypothetical protein